MLLPQKKTSLTILRVHLHISLLQRTYPSNNIQLLREVSLISFFSAKNRFQKGRTLRHIHSHFPRTAHTPGMK